MKFIGTLRALLKLNILWGRYTQSGLSSFTCPVRLNLSALARRRGRKNINDISSNSSLGSTANNVASICPTLLCLKQMCLEMLVS